MKRILLTNDDGYQSKGLTKLAKMLQSQFKAEVTIVAPANEKSACSHSITLTKPLRLEKVKKGFYKLEDGTPADCIYLALHALYKNHLPDLVISGINRGANVGEDITYSGTCAGAMEAALHGICALALSQFYQDEPNQLDLKRALNITKKIVKRIFKKGFPLDRKEFLNINFPSPKAHFKGIKICKAGKRIYSYEAHSNVNPRGIKYFWLASTSLDHENERKSDIALLKQGYATITPIMLDLTAYKKIKTIKKWMENG